MAAHLRAQGPKGKSTVIFDPAVAYGLQEEAYFAALFCAEIPGPHIPEYYMEIARSHDGGTVWDTPTRVEGFSDRPYLAIDDTRGKRRGRIYCSSGLPGGGHGIRTSDNGGRSFHLSEASRLHVPPPAQALNTGQSVVLSDGTLVLPYIYFLKGKDAKLQGGGAEAAGLSTRCSTNGGLSIEPRQSQIAVCQHTDRDGLPMLAANAKSVRFKDRLCLVWSSALPTGHRVMFAYSQDKGVSWSKPILLSEQSKTSEGAGKSQADTSPVTSQRNRYDAFLPSVAVNKNGVVGAWWYDTRALPDGRTGWDARFRASLDGGRTWTPSVKVTSKISILGPQSDPRTSDITWVGDTAGMAADAEGAFHLLWIDSRAGLRQVFTASVKVEAQDDDDRFP